MANGRHLLKLNEGVEAWNTWRKGNPYLMPDLRWANLRSVDLRKADLRWADLRWADLHSALLSSANLTGADLRRACLNSANISTANLIGADLRDTSLKKANLIGANLSGADLRWADLRGADLRKAQNLSGKQLAKTATFDDTKLDPDLVNQIQNPTIARRHGRKVEEDKPDISACPHCRRDRQ